MTEKLSQFASGGAVITGTDTLVVVRGGNTDVLCTAGSAINKGASDATKANVASVSGATAVGHVATFADTLGTVQDGGAIGTAASKAASSGSSPTVASVTGAVSIGNLAVFADVNGTVQDGGAIPTPTSSLPFTSITGTATPAQLPVATSSAFGAVKPDNSTITISAGVISTTGGSGPAYLKGSGTSTLTGTNSIALGNSVTVAANNTIYIGSNSTSFSNDDGCISIGDSTNTGSGLGSVGCIAIGNGAVANTSESVAVGHNATANTGSQAIAIGTAGANATQAIAIGANSAATFDNAIAIGHSTSSGNQSSICIGNSAFSSFDYDIVIGQPGHNQIGITNSILTFAGITLDTPASAVATMTNAPTGAAGNPQIWAKMSVNGTTYTFPLWTV